MTCKEFLEDYIKRGKEQASKQEISMIYAALEQLSSLQIGDFYQKEKENWKEDDELMQMPDGIEEETFYRAEDIYIRMPSYMRYETIKGAKEKYNTILSLIKQMRNMLYDEEKGLYYDSYNKQTGEKLLESGEFTTASAAFYLMGMIDLMSSMSDEIFEQYKQYESLFKEGVRGILAYYSSETPIFSVCPYKAQSEENPEDIQASLILSYALMKGCGMYTLLKEKYFKLAESIFLMCVQRLNENNTFEEAAGELALAYSQYMTMCDN